MPSSATQHINACPRAAAGCNCHRSCYALHSNPAGSQYNCGKAGDNPNSSVFGCAVPALNAVQTSALCVTKKMTQFATCGVASSVQLQKTAHCV